MKKTTLLPILLLTTLAQAGGNVVEQSAVIEPIVEPTIDSSAFYIGASYSTLKLSNDTTKEEFTSNTSLTLQVGYQYNSYIAIEGRYSTSLGAVDYRHGEIAGSDIDDFDTDFSNIAIFIKPIYPVANFNIYALLGYGEVTLTNINRSDRSVSGFEWGVGVEYMITENLSAFIDYSDLYDDQDFDGLGTDADHLADSWSLGITYRF